MAIEIELTKGLIAVIDDVDADIALSKWSASSFPYPYAVRKVRNNDGATDSQMHRVIMSRIENRELSRSELVDHVNGNSLDNRRDNLRLASASENQYNAKRRSDNTTGYKGVYWHKKNNKWSAQIKVGGKRIYLGRFNTPEEAHNAYCIAAKAYHGEFARFE